MNGRRIPKPDYSGLGQSRNTKAPQVRNGRSPGRMMYPDSQWGIADSLREMSQAVVEGATNGIFFASRTFKLLIIGTAIVSFLLGVLLAHTIDREIIYDCPEVQQARYALLQEPDRNKSD